MSINSFSGNYRFLSNFWLCSVPFDGIDYPSSENAFQAMKCKEHSYRWMFRDITPGAAKRLGKSVALREDWDEVRLNVMLGILRVKFFRHEDLRLKLIATGDQELIEGNYWNDTFWGVCPVPTRTIQGSGENHLGKLLMQVRDEARLL